MPNDPLHSDNLPAWCDGVTAVDAIDAIIILILVAIGTVACESWPTSTALANARNVTTWRT